MSRWIDAEWLEELFPDTGEGEWTYNATVLGYIDSAPTIDAVSEWIPCSERLPNEGELVLVSNPYISGVGYYRNRHWYIANNVSWDAWSITDVVAWMPLPKPWKGADDE